ncbi:MAG TPA: LacI family DNA-binding transcriptional regulator [Jiangellales bacterium]|nr:LacI family DNA-binding transcriptional regulator [Jiangellales bacterium]
MATRRAASVGQSVAPAGPAGASSGRARPTLEMVAARAGVSRATVSRVVNGSTTVAPEIRETVLRAVAALGYVPNLAARSLVTQRTDSYALVVPEPANRVFSDDPFFSIVIRGVSEALEKADKQLVLMLANSTTSHDRVERFAMAGHVDGVMFVSMHGADPLPVTLTRLGVPVVCNERPLGRVSVPYVGVDNAGGAAAATRHLLASGRARIATIAGPLDMVGGIDRLAGYRAALKGSKSRPMLAVGDFTRESGVAAMRQLLDSDPDIDAVFVASDLMADGALRALRQAGRRVPEDVAVVGFDDIEVARFTEPPLTTVRQPILSIGRELVRMVLRLAGGEEVDSSVMLPTELIIRESA